MKITEKQLLCLVDILKDSFNSQIEISSQFTITRGHRVSLYSAILNQQSDRIIEVKDE